MSFFKKFTSEIKEMFGDEKDKKDATKAQDSSSTNAPHGDFAHAGPPQQFNQQYPQQQYGGPPPGHSDSSQLPPGWTKQWDAQSQRWYYIEQSTGRSQWEPPSGDRGFGSGPPPQQGGYGYPGPQQHGMPQGYPQQDPHYQGYPTGDQTHAKPKSSNKGMLAAGAGGLAVGALAGHALSGDSSDEEGHMAQTGGYGTAPAGYGYPSGAPPAAAPPLEDNPELSSSQRSSLQEAREDYEEAQKEVAEDSSASSSDVEDLQEAREEYQEEQEEAQEELEDD